MLIGSHIRGVARSRGDEIEVLDLPFDDLGAALNSGLTPADIRSAGVRETVHYEQRELRAPIPRPSALWIVGRNFQSHSDEAGIPDVPQVPLMVLISSAAICGPFDPIRLPSRAPKQVDYEGEVAVVIGRDASCVSIDEAWSHVLGLSAMNDVSARDVQWGRYFDDDWDHTKAKSFDTFKPFGPWIATVDEYADPNDVGIRTLVDGVERQQDRTSNLIFSIAECIAFLSEFTTLRAGDVISTGTTDGVGLSSLGDHLAPWGQRDQPRPRPVRGAWQSTLEGDFLKPGSTVRVEVEGVGAIENEVLAPLS